MSKQKSYDRRTYVKAAAALGVAGLAGCTDDDDGGNTLEVMHGWQGGDGGRAIEALIDAFEAEYPDIDTDFRAIGGGGNIELDQAVAQRLRDGDPSSIFAAWPGQNLTRYEGALGDIEETVWEEDDLLDAHAPEVVDACRHQGGFSAVPIGSHRMNDLFYNPNVLDDAGVDPDSITDFDSLIDAFETIATETDATPYVNALAAWTTLQSWAVVMQGSEGYDAYMNFIEGNGDRDAVRRTFERMETILDEYLNADAPEIDFTEANQRLMSGEGAFIHSGNWAAGAFVSEELEFGEDWDRIQFPGTEDMYGFHLDSFVYPGDNPSPEESQTFLRFVGSETGQIEFNRWKGSIPTRDVDTSEFNQYLVETIEDFQSAELRPPTLAHGLAVTPGQQENLEDALNDHFLDPFDVEDATDAFMNAL